MDDIDYSNKRVLVIDDHPGMRSSIRITLSNFGVTKTDMVQNALEAVRRIKEAEYDIIVCDYYLGGGRDGQQLLEELRHTKLIKLSTVFLMVTAERTYEQVMRAVELAPDDYLIKPFTAEALRQRLNQVVKKKMAFATVHEAMDRGEIEKAIVSCDKVMGLSPAYTIDAIRLKAELLIAIGHLAEAQQLYEQVITMRAIPWARMGLAKTLFLQDKLHESEIQLLDLVHDAPEYLAAHDLLAHVQELEHKQDEALATLSKAVERNPNALLRQRSLGELAMTQGELEIAEKAFATVVEKGLHSVLRQPDDHARLARVQVDQDKLTEAGATLKELRKHYPNNTQAEFSASVVESLKEIRAGNPEAAKQALENAFKLKQDSELQPSEAMTLDLAQACLASGREEEGQALVQQLVNNNHENALIQARARKLYADVGRAEEGEKIVKAAIQAAVSLNNDAVMLARQGDLQGAADMLCEAARKLPNNVQILLNAAHAILTLLAKNGWDGDKGRLALALIEKARRRNPEHPKLVKVTGLYRDLARKFGVKK